MVIVVTGSSGYLGSVLIPRLAREHQVVGLDLHPPPPSFLYRPIENFEFFPCDLSAPSQEMANILAKADLIVHLAGLVGYPACEKNRSLAYRCNVTTTETVLNLKHIQTPIIFSSTISNYGANEGTRVDENSPLHPCSYYGETKVKAEELVRNTRAFIVLRFASAYGISPKMRFDNLVHDFCQYAVKKRTLSLYESHFVRQFIHVVDMAEAITFCVSNFERLSNQIFNVGNKFTELTKRDIIQAIHHFCPLTFREDIFGFDKEKRNYLVSFDKIESYGFEPRISLIQAIPKIVSYFISLEQLYGTLNDPIVPIQSQILAG